MSEFGQEGEPVRPVQPMPASGFEFNRPTMISLLYLCSFFTGITALVGVVLAYVWRGETHEPWETTHYRYLIRTFWLGLLGGILGAMLTLVLIGFLILPAVVVLVVVRCVLSLVNAQKRQPMPNAETWLA